MYNLEISKQVLYIEGERYSAEDFYANSTSCFSFKSDFHRDLFNFLKDWFSESSTLLVQTSGSTGTPKEMRVEKQRMMESARLTCSFLNLKQGDTALLCMPLHYIAGKMMVVRVLVAQLDLYLVTPSGNPLKETDQMFQFAAMTPMQVFNTVHADAEKLKLQQIENLIIGGAAIDTQLSDTLRNFPNKIYSTYGMTETLSHIALRRLSGVESTNHYYPFDSVLLSLSADETLIINAPLVAEELLYTNDVAKLYEDGSFEIVGRKDNIINSGGIKIQIEQLEALLLPFLNCPFAISSLSDPKFGEIVVLVLEGGGECGEKFVFPDLASYYLPKKTICLEKIPRTDTGKIARFELKKQILELSK